METAPPEQSSPAPPAACYTVTELGRAGKPWQLAVYPGHLALRDAPEAQPYILLRAGFPKEFNFAENLRALVVAKPFKATLKLTPEATAAVADWFGPSFLATYQLKRRYGMILPWAVLWLLLALPLPGTAAPELAAKPFEPVRLIVALALLGGWALARWRPHPLLFLGDALWFGYLTVHFTQSILAGQSKLWLLFVGFLALMTVTGLRHFRRFRHVTLNRPG